MKDQHKLLLSPTPSNFDAVNYVMEIADISERHSIMKKILPHGSCDWGSPVPIDLSASEKQ